MTLAHGAGHLAASPQLQPVQPRGALQVGCHHGGRYQALNSYRKGELAPAAHRAAVALLLSVAVDADATHSALCAEP